MRNKMLHCMMIKKGVNLTVLIILLMLCANVGNSGYFGAIAHAELKPSIKIQPGARVEVGEEVFFSATGTTYEDATILRKARYEWDFGDGYYHRYDPVNHTITRQGIAATHYYMKPGNFTARLKVTIWKSFDEAGVPSPVETTSADTITMALGSVSFSVEKNKSYIAGMTGKVMTVGTTPIYALYGTISSYNPATGALVVNVRDKYGAGTYSSWRAAFQPFPIAVKETSISVHVTGEAPMEGFEIQRAPFHSRLAQYLYVQIPKAYRGNKTTLVVSLAGAKGSSRSLLVKNNLSPEERVFLNQEPLVKDDYVVIAQLLDANGGRIPGGLWRDKFSKKYDGIPRVGIDENNSFRVNGKLFFPVAPFMIGKSEYRIYADKASINAVNTEGYFPKHSPETWGIYLDQVNIYNLMAIGPGRGDYSIGASPNRWRFNHNTDRMADYVKKTKDKPMMFAWIWQDEPNLGGRTEKVYPPTLAAWNYVCHRDDPQHPAYSLYVGNDWTRLYGKVGMYDYLGSAPLFGGKKWVQDVFSFDLYPISQRRHPSFNFVDMGPYAVYAETMDRIKEFNKDLVPMVPAIQPCKGMQKMTWPSITEEALYMETWLNVIHGAKGIVWFNYFDMANTARWGAMKKFTDQIKALTPVVLSPLPARVVKVDANVALNRVDTMIREKDGNIYIFAVRVTEPDPVPEVKYQGVEPETIAVNFTVSGLRGRNTGGVVDEDRAVSLSNGQFTDTFRKNAVHIYKIPVESH